MLKRAAKLPSDQAAVGETPAPVVVPEVEERPTVAPKDLSPGAMRELLEKNLKWSQIIYEQNRKINSKLLWTAVANWLRLFVVVIPLILAVWYLPTIMKELRDKYGLFLNAAARGQLSPATMNSLLDVLPINSVEREQLKAMLQPTQQNQK